jgi:DNA-directed RNA polymerase specialized sigma24 family protein
MRLVGATPRQVSVISAAESTVAAAAGVAAGFGLYFLLRPVLVTVDFTGTPFFLGDLSLTATDVLMVAIGVPVAAALSARIALRRVQISPLGVTRRTTPRPPRAYRLVPLVAGFLELAWFIGRDPRTSAGQVRAFLPGALLVLGGIVLAGPWLTMTGARFMARRTGRPAPLVAGRRLSDDPKAGFRAVSGLVLALCVTSATVGIIGALVAERGLPHGNRQIRDTLIGDYLRFDRQGPHGTVSTSPDSLLAALRSVPGVSGVTVIHTDPGPGPGALGGPVLGGGLAACDQLAGMPVFGTCPPGAGTASVNATFSTYGLDFVRHWPSVWPADTRTPEELRHLPVQEIVVTSDGSASALERARTLLAAAYPDQDMPYTVPEDRAQASQELDEYKQLADVVIAVSFPVAGCSLAVSVAGGLSDRRRPFSLLRLAGVPLRTLRRVVLLESALPLLVVAAVAIGTGFLAAQLFVRAQFGYSLRAPGAEYYLMVAGGLVAALGVIAAAGAAGGGLHPAAAAADHGTGDGPQRVTRAGRSPRPGPPRRAVIRCAAPPAAGPATHRIPAIGSAYRVDADQVLDITPLPAGKFDRSSIDSSVNGVDCGEDSMSTVVQPLHGVTSGGGERFESEVLPHLDRVYAGARQMASDPAAAERLVQRTFERAFRDFHWARPTTDVPAWLYHHMVNAWFEEEPRLRGLRASGTGSGAKGGGTVDAMMRGALGTLAPVVRITVYLADVEGFSKQEIARITEVPAGIVESRIRRAHQQLAGRLTQWLEDDGRPGR